MCVRFSAWQTLACTKQRTFDEHASSSSTNHAVEGASLKAGKKHKLQSPKEQQNTTPSPSSSIKFTVTPLAKARKSTTTCRSSSSSQKVVTTASSNAVQGTTIASTDDGQQTSIVLGGAPPSGCTTSGRKREKHRPLLQRIKSSPDGEGKGADHGGSAVCGSVGGGYKSVAAAAATVTKAAGGKRGKVLLGVSPMASTMVDGNHESAWHRQQQQQGDEELNHTKGAVNEKRSVQNARLYEQDGRGTVVGDNIPSFSSPYVCPAPRQEPPPSISLSEISYTTASSEYYRANRCNRYPNYREYSTVVDGASVVSSQLQAATASNAAATASTSAPPPSSLPLNNGAETTVDVSDFLVDDISPSLLPFSPAIWKNESDAVVPDISEVVGIGTDPFGATGAAAVAASTMRSGTERFGGEGEVGGYGEAARVSALTQSVAQSSPGVINDVVGNYEMHGQHQPMLIAEEDKDSPASTAAQVSAVWLHARSLRRSAIELSL